MSGVRIVNVPNAFTLLRLLLVAPVMVLVHTGRTQAALVTYVVLLSTDAFDGYFARKLKQETDFGEYFDFVVDFAGYYTLLLYFIFTGAVFWLNTALIAVASVVLVWITLTLARKARRPFMPHRRSSKVLAFLLIAAIVGLILGLGHKNHLLFAVLVVVWAYPLPDYIRFTLKYRPEAV